MVNEYQSSLVDCLIAQSTDLICICDERGTIIKINDTFAKNAGKTADMLIGTLIDTLFSDKNEKLNSLLQTKVLNIVADEHFSNTIKEDDGSLKCVTWHISVFRDLRIIRGAVSKSHISNPSLYTDRRLKAIADNASDCFFILDRALNIIFRNSAADKKFSHPQFGADSNVFFASFPEETNRKFFDHFLSALDTNSHLKFVEFSTILNSWFTIDVLPYEDELNILVNDISDKINDHHINELELKTFELNIAKDRPVNDIFLYLLTAFEKLYPQFHTSILKIEDQKIWHVASPNLPLQFIWAIEGSEISAEAGSCGAAAYIKKNVITYDIEMDEKWVKYHHLIAPYGYKSCWSFPIISNKSLEVMATFAIYTKVNLIPTENELKSIARICNIVKIIFEDLKQDDILLMMNNRYEMVTMATNDAIYDWNLKTNDVYWSENLLNIFGFTPQEAHQTKNWWLSHLHRDDRAETIALLKSCLREKKSGWVVEYRLRCKNGNYKHVYNRGYIIYDAKQVPKAVIGAIQDITDLKEREIEIVNQNNKLKEIAQIGSHELRRPVTSILGLVSLFNRQNMADENNKVIVDYLQKASKELDEVIHTIVAKTLAADEAIYHKHTVYKTAVSLKSPQKD